MKVAALRGCAYSGRFCGCEQRIVCVDVWKKVADCNAGYAPGGEVCDTGGI